MNKQELIDHCKTLKEDKNRFINCIDVDRIINTIKQLDEPQKVTIPQFVADYIEFKKKYNFHVYGAMRTIEDYHDKKVSNWFYEGNIEKFCLAWILGYEVKEEKRYTVVMKETKQPLYYNALDKKLFFSMGGLATNFTQQQLEEAGFAGYLIALALKSRRWSDGIIYSLF